MAYLQKFKCLFGLLKNQIDIITALCCRALKIMLAIVVNAFSFDLVSIDDLFAEVAMRSEMMVTVVIVVTVVLLFIALILVIAILRQQRFLSCASK